MKCESGAAPQGVAGSDRASDILLVLSLSLFLLFFVIIIIYYYQYKFRSICIVHQVLLHNMGGGQGHLERFLPKAKAPRLSKSVQRLYTQHNPNTDRSFQLEKHFVKIARALRTTKDRGRIRAGRMTARSAYAVTRWQHILCFAVYDDADDD